MTPPWTRPIFNQMVEYQTTLDQTFHALANPARRSMLASLRDGPRTIGELAEPLEISFAATSKHLGILESAGLIQRERLGRQRRCRLCDQGLLEAMHWLDQHAAFWNARLDDLERALVNDPGQEPDNEQPRKHK